MALLRQADELQLNGSLVTLRQAVKVKQTTYTAMRAWLLSNPKVRLMRVGSTLVVDLNELDGYQTREQE